MFYCVVSNSLYRRVCFIGGGSCGEVGGGANSGNNVNHIIIHIHA